MKAKSMYVCSNCAYETPKWYGRCPSCGEWNTLQESVVQEQNQVAYNGTKKVSVSKTGKQAKIHTIEEVDIEDEVRFKTGLSELDRSLGGGIVKGSLVLLSGDPGIGKSTLLLQICQYLGQNLKILYVSGEESVRQIKLRANRLSVNSDNLFLLANTDVETVCNTIVANCPDIVMIDSIQTMCIEKIQSSPGSVLQVRESTNAFLHVAKNEDIPIILVGHVNKDGAIAGPKVLEHIVDAVLYFEGDRNQSYRILRAVKNRFGSTNEIGVFEMQDKGLCEVTNPSQMMLQGRPKNASGSCVACVMEGTRPMLVEVQGLVTKTNFGTPRRTSTGFDYNRMVLLLAVLEKRCGYFFANCDAFVNVVGGLKLIEPSSDLSVALALISALKDEVIDPYTLAFGEIGLTGEVRSVSQITQRVKESQRLGFKKCIVPLTSLRALNQQKIEDMEIIGVKDIGEAVKYALS